MYLTGLTIVNFLISCARDSGLSSPVTLVLRRVLWNGFFVFIATVMASRIYILGMYLINLSIYVLMYIKFIILDILKSSNLQVCTYLYTYKYEELSLIILDILKSSIIQVCTCTHLFTYKYEKLSLIILDICI